MFADEYLRNTQEYDELVQEIERREAAETKKAADDGGQESERKKAKRERREKDLQNKSPDAVKRELIDLANRAWEDKSFQGRVSFAPSKKLHDKVKELLGHDIGEVFVTANRIRHIKEHHGEGEESRGQVDIKPEYFDDLYDIINDFDKAELGDKDDLGNQGIVLSKDGVGVSFTIISERGMSRAEVVTFYKHKKKKAPRMSDAQSPEQNVQNDSGRPPSSATSSVPLVLCQDLKQIKMRIFHREINICSLSCIYAII